MSIIAYIVLSVYTLALSYITIYCVLQFSLLYHYKKAERKTGKREVAKVAGTMNAKPVRKKSLALAASGSDAAEEAYTTDEAEDNTANAAVLPNLIILKIALRCIFWMILQMKL